MAVSRFNQKQIVLFAGVSVVAASLFYYLFYMRRWASKKKGFDSDLEDITRKDGDLRQTTKTSNKSTGIPPPTTPDPKRQSAAADDKTPLVKNTNTEQKEVHEKIESLDKKGKTLFKDKKYMEAAQAFTEALELIESQNDTSGALARQVITLLNNRSAMMEKGNVPELAVEDCMAILEKDPNHTKARTRKLRLLETMKQWHECLVEVCALQLLFMKANRANLQMGLPVPPPPVPQSKMEELLAQVVPGDVEKYSKRLRENKKRPLPSSYTILQLLKSYSGYNKWMAAAAKDGNVEKITKEMPEASDVESTAKRATLLMKRGRRHVYEKRYELATNDFEEAYALVESNEEAQNAMEDDSYARLLEWTGMVRHWHYQLGASLACYQKCADIEPMNADLLVKQAGVQMDSGKHDEAMKLFDMALGIDETAVDALLHRSNLQMLQGKHQDAKRDLERSLELRPNHVMARLRLASILAATDDASGAKKQLDLAEQEDPNSSEVQSHRGELLFTQGQMEEARKQFERAIELEPNNPTPYVNAAMALLNMPPAPGQMPDAAAVMTLLENAITVDPQFTAAYMQLGQLALGTATELTAAREVISLYDRGLENCRSEEEIKELCSMRILAVAQVEAASTLGMETFNMQ